MNYMLHYERLIQKHGLVKRPVTKIYYERHHIFPKALGGDDSKENLIYLTARCHFIAHWLLWKITDEPKMAMAFYNMTINREQYSFTEFELRSARKVLLRASNFCKRVQTPIGIFDTCRDAASAYGLADSTMQDRIRGDDPNFFYLDTERCVVAKAGGQHGMSRRIHTPLGDFSFVGEAAVAHKVSNKTLNRRCEQSPSDYYYLDPPKQKRVGLPSNNSKKVHTPFGVFDSIMKAAIGCNVSRETMRSHIAADCHKDYYFI